MSGATSAQRHLALAEGVVEVVETGSGADAVVLVHGAASSPQAMGRLATRLATPGWRVVAPALDGYGGTVMQGGGDTLTRNARMLAGLCATLAARRVLLVGHSMGGLVALTALRHGLAVDAAVLCEPVAFGALDAQDPEQRAARDWDRAMAAGMAEHMAHGHVEDAVAGFIGAWSGQVWADMPAAVRAGLVAMGRRLAMDVGTVSLDMTPADAYAGITAPVLLLCGDASPPAARLICARLAGALPRARVAAVAAAGHMAPVAQPGLIAPLIQAFRDAMLPDGA